VVVPYAAVELCRRFEGFRAAPYRCPAGIPTIGYGTTHYDNGAPVKLTDPQITPAEASWLLVSELERCSAGVLRLCPAIADEPAGRLAALADFSYNLGIGRLRTSTLREKVNAADWAGATDEFGKWVWAGGRKLAGLVARRAAEAALFAAPSAGSYAVDQDDRDGQ
jgi:lysozyme